MVKNDPCYKFAEKAERDLEDIISYTLQQWGATQAHAYIDGLEAQDQLLADNPDLGVKRESLSKGLLSFPYESHILYYVKQPHGITIVRVLHQNMDPMKHI
ncbi:type II toxin-antitoxin system RelE/ParE family toxin [bacterium endosymbiont of Escarpia laminata]|nr:MAG: type II toxin-antitoxin system RelE/ParE family toxin [bacterium endosymbiont of Escarpia laminata]RLJ20746.1 MAG: type II toxin-antitoxin system RelE/ParE family toxin [bacterium endosymbiont of Escarpia laminata]